MQKPVFTAGIPT